jgi:hypothetical protein
MGIGTIFPGLSDQGVKLAPKMTCYLIKNKEEFIFALFYKGFTLRCLLITCLASTLKDVDSTFEISVNFYQNVRCHNPEISNINRYRCEILKSSEVALWL